MATRILDLPLLSFSATIQNNEDWTDAWAYVDAAAAPIPFTGLTLVMMARYRASDPTAQIVAASVAGDVGGVFQNGLITIGGDGQNVVALAIPKSTTARLAPGDYVFEVQATGDGITRTIATGPLTVNQGIVR